jgi:hypothetical protein
MAIEVCDTIASFLHYTGSPRLHASLSPPPATPVPGNIPTSTSIVPTLPSNNPVTSTPRSGPTSPSGSDSSPIAEFLKFYGVEIDELSISHSQDLAPSPRERLHVSSPKRADSSTALTPAGRSRPPMVAGSTRSTTTERTYGPRPVPSPLQTSEPGRSIDNRIGQPQATLPTESPVVPQHHSSADTSSRTGRKPLRRDPGVSQTLTREESDSAALSENNRSFLDSIRGGDSGIAGPSTNNTLGSSISSSRNNAEIRTATTEDSPRPKPSGIKTSLSRMGSWLGRRGSSPQEHAGFRTTHLGCLVPVSEGLALAVEMWSLDRLIDRWIAGSSSESDVLNSMVDINFSSDILKDGEFQDVFLATYATFTDSQAVFENLRLRFEAAAAGDEPAQTRAFRRIRYLCEVIGWSLTITHSL